VEHRATLPNPGFGARIENSRRTGDIVKAKNAYGDLLTLWKNADADIPVLEAARAEYARLQ
jgi:hypothetical protein